MIIQKFMSIYVREDARVRSEPPKNLLGVADGRRNEFHVIYCVLFFPAQEHSENTEIYII